MVPVSEGQWSVLEDWLETAFAGQVRKNGQPMAEHPLRVGRKLRAAGADPVTVFSGYAHGVIEDLPHVAVEDLAAVAEAVIGRKAARESVDLMLECGYSDEEYAVERLVGGEDGKKARRAAAVRRWLAGKDFRLHLVKQADIEDSLADAASASPELAADFLSWAGPLHDGLTALLAARDMAG